MGGSLYHSREFRQEHYTAKDGIRHFEVRPVDGDFDGISYTTWTELIRYGAAAGVPPDVWPDFTKYQCAIDVPLDEVAAKQEPLQRAVAGLSAEVIEGNWILAKIAIYLKNGEQVYFC